MQPSVYLKLIAKMFGFDVNAKSHCSRHSRRINLHISFLVGTQAFLIHVHDFVYACDTTGTFFVNIYVNKCTRLYTTSLSQIILNVVEVNERCSLIRCVRFLYERQQTRKIPSQLTYHLGANICPRVCVSMLSTSQQMVTKQQHTKNVLIFSPCVTVN